MNGSPPHARENPDAQLHSPHQAASRAKRILLADDDPGVRDSLAAVLTLEGYEVVNAENGRQVLELAASMDFELLLLDLNMPVKSGWETLEQLVRERPLLPVVILTARSNQLFTALGAGVGALLEKPVDIPNLLSIASRLISEPTETRVARAAGRSTTFHYAASHARH